MKLYSERLEKTVLLSICESKQKYQSRLLSALNDEHFHSPAASEARKRMTHIVKKTGEVPNWLEICSDPVISEESRRILCKFDADVINSSKETRSSIDTMYKYYQLRKMYFIADSVVSTLQNDNVDVDKLADTISNEITKIRIKHDAHQAVYHIGKGYNVGSLIDDVLNPESDDYIPTGIKAFDIENGGIFYGSLFTLIGSTSGGKSSLAIQLLLNMARYEPVLYVPLEMTAKESMVRIVSNISQVSMKKILQHKLTEREEKHIRKSNKRYSDELAEIGSRYSIYSPDGDVKIENILSLIKPYGHRVAVIDYISLLDGVNGDDSWKQLGQVARFCKIYAKENNMIIILLAQANDEGIIRYSRAITEHSNNAWAWVATDETREAGVINIKQQKARNQKLFNFTIGFDDERMTFYDIDSKDKQESSEKSEQLKDLTEGKHDKPVHRRR